MTETPHGWQPLESAPYNTPVEIKAGSMTFLARLLPDAAFEEDDTTCDQWQAEIEGEHPPCWSEGACWSSNLDEVESLQPTAWRHPLPTTANNPEADVCGEMLSALRWIADNYENGMINHVDFRVEAKHRADAALTKAEVTHGIL